MRKLIKRLALLLCSCLMLSFVLTGCGREKKLIEYDSAQVENSVQTILSILESMENVPESREGIAESDEEQLENISASLRSYFGIYIEGAAFQSGFESYLKAIEEIGPIKETGNVEITSDEDEITVDVMVNGTGMRKDGTPQRAEMELLMTRSLKITSVTFNVYKDFGEKMTGAALNTLLGMGTTFSVLILISVIIYLMSFIPKIIEGSGGQKAAPAEPAQPEKEKAVGNIPEKGPESASEADAAVDDGELIAVIAAAIAAYESENTGVYVSPDTLIVRSVKRRTSGR